VHRHWLDSHHGFALRKWELQIDRRLVRVVNAEFGEVLQGFRLSQHGRIEVSPSQDVPAEYRDRALWTEELMLRLTTVNKVPDGVALEMSDRELGRQFHPPSEPGTGVGGKHK
jgi:hypothetical protein